jgi:hypothetical protein
MDPKRLRKIMGFVERELERVSAAVRARQADASLGDETSEYRQLYAVQQALSWALEPEGFKAPYDLILGTGTQEDSVDYPVNNRQVPS